MLRTISSRRWLGLGCLLSAMALTALAQTKPIAKTKWTFEEAKKQFLLAPQDVYLQFVALQTAKREKIPQNELYFFDNNRRGGGRREGVDLFNTFSGALAVQESLQLDSMRDGNGQDRTSFVAPAPEKEARDDGLPRPVPLKTEPATDPKVRVKVASLQGPTIQSHPWEAMLAGRKPDLGTLANCVPDDYYFIEFSSAAKLMATLAATDLWTGHLFAQMMGSAQSQDLERRLKLQLGIQGIPPALLDSAGLEGIAITGSDLYLADGSDVTLLVKGQKLVSLRKAIESLVQQKPGVQKSEGKYLDYPYTLSTSADRSVHVFAADPRPDLHVRSNSLPAFQKVLAAIAGKNEQGIAVKRLGETTEFAYIRSILPRTAAEEDGLVYLSDPCIRRLLGPRVKLAQQQRVRAYNHLKMIERAALMFRTENGRAPGSLEELATAGCAPAVFGTGKWACPAGGKYTLCDDGMSASSSIFGKPGWMTPLLEIPLDTVSGNDADAYKQFLQEYNQYWRTFFDPIAVRVKVTPEQFRLETVVLPLIDNSIYTTLADSVGGKVVPLSTLPTPPKTIHSVTVHLHKEPLLKLLPQEDSNVQGVISKIDDLEQLMLAMHNFHSDYNRFPSQAQRSKEGKPLFSWRVMLLPYLEQVELFKQFKLDEPWDSDHNKKLIEKMPKIYSTGDAALDKEFKTRMLAPVGANTIFPPAEQKITLGAIQNARGTSNTIALVEATADKAVVWTKPDDLVINEKKPREGLLEANQPHFQAVTADGTAYRIRGDIDDAHLRTLLQWKGDAQVVIGSFGTARLRTPRNRSLLRDLPFFDTKLLRQFLEQGIGDHLTYQVMDAAQPITADVSGFIGSESPLGMLFGTGGSAFGGEMVLFGLFAQSLTNPVCVSIPVNDGAIVDRFLTDVDQRMAELPRQLERFIRMDKYQVALGDKKVRIFSVKVFGINFRIAWARMGNWLVITNHPAMLDELASFYDKQPRFDAATVPATAESGHAQFRIRPSAWNAVLPGYRLGWAENHRIACEVNQQQIANLARAYPELLSADGGATPELFNRVFQIYGTHPFCPDAGNYHIGKTGACNCSIHGQAFVNPQQLLAPRNESHTMKSLAQFKGLSATITFLEDGLHAVVTIDRK